MSEGGRGKEREGERERQREKKEMLKCVSLRLRETPGLRTEMGYWLPSEGHCHPGSCL